MRALVTVIALALVSYVASGVTLRAEQANPPAPAAKTAPAPVNLNTASVEQLVALPGIGERTARQIVEYREKNGPFKKPEDLMNIKGIGEKSFLRLKNLVSVPLPRTDRPPSDPQ